MSSKQHNDLVRKQELNDIRTVLNNAAGRRFMHRLMNHCGTFSSTFSESTQISSYRSGKQDVGHFLMAEISSADVNLLMNVIKEANKGESDGR